MVSHTTSAALDLLVIGGMTVDRFANRSSLPGGSVMHIARAAAPRGLRLGVVTTAGPEPEAQAGLTELRRLCTSVDAARHDASTTFRHRESAEGRRLWLERAGGSVALGPDAPERLTTHAVLYAPVGGEIGADALLVWDERWQRGAILQGWLRSADASAVVEPLPLSGLQERLLRALGRFDLLVASREDLVADAERPADQLAALRDAVGPTPVLVVTDGPDGLWLDLPGEGSRSDRPLHFPAPWRVDTPSTVGAGDILAAFLTVRADDPSVRWEQKAELAMRAVAEELEQRPR